MRKQIACTGALLRTTGLALVLLTPAAALAQQAGSSEKTPTPTASPQSPEGQSAASQGDS
jgi:hypothetical protein